jgi:hypothetical protein
MARNRRGRRAAGALAGSIALALVAPLPAWSGAMRDCVERGGTYLENGTCEMRDDEAAQQCRHQGGRYLASSGRCELPRVDPIERCKQAGGVTIHEGTCYRLRRRDDPLPPYR